MGVEMCSSLAKIGAGCSTAFLTKSFHQIAQFIKLRPPWTPWTTGHPGPPGPPPPSPWGSGMGSKPAKNNLPLEVHPMTNFTSLKNAPDCSARRQ